MSIMAELEQRQVTDEDVLQWRFETLRAAGYRRTAARLLSQRADIDLHLAVELLERGCADHIAFAILY